MLHGQVCTEVAKGGYGRKGVVVRINSLDSPWGEDDIRDVAKLDIDAVVMPKASRVSQSAEFQGSSGELPVSKETRAEELFRGYGMVAVQRARPRCDAAMLRYRLELRGQGSWGVSTCR